MNARQLLAELEQAGVILAPRGDRLHVDAPKGVVSDEIRHQMVRHKPELLRLVQESTESTSKASQVAAMKLNDFARAGLVVKVESEVLGTELLLVSDNVPRSQLEGCTEVVYRARELKKLARLPPDPPQLRTVQMVKEILGGTILGVQDRPPSSAIDASATAEVS